MAISKEIGGTWYYRVALKNKEMRERDDEEDLSIEDWITIIQEFKERERKKDEVEKL